MSQMKAWLVTWEWDGDHAKVEEPVVAVLNSRRSAEQVREIVELLYANQTYSFSERLAYAKNKTKNPYPAKWGDLNGNQWTGEVYCGHNPFLYARIVDNLQVQGNSTGDEELTWSEQSKPTLKTRRKPKSC